jgi:hypothetical protein
MRRFHLPAAVRAATLLLPIDQRDAIVGDLIECSVDEWGPSGVRTNTWMSVQCLTIGLGLRATQLRDRVVVEAAREVLDGVRMETARALRQTLRRPGTLAAALIALAIAAGATAAAGFVVQAVTRIDSRPAITGGLAWVVKP